MLIEQLKASVMWMIHLFWRGLIFAALASAVLLSTACSKISYRVLETLRPPVTWTAAYRQGRSEAKNDLANGNLRYRTYGLQEGWNGPNLYAEHLLNDYNIELVTVAGCIVTEELVNRTRGYNETALPVIEARYGKGILERVHKQAVDEWKQTHPAR
jgi:hypothetical protein